MIISRFTWRL